MDTFERRCFVLEGLLDIGPTKAKQLIERFGTPFRVFEAIKFTKILYTSTGNPKGIQGPLDTLRGFGPKFIRKNKKLILGKEDKVKKDKEKSVLDEYI
ncbi:MAG: hypothetical protein GF311_03425 [Candidatus Lokiarchaeota archaeon]|nr:hypothetical protein [Candidatus Lokiarchaeota archaeon]